MSGNWGYSFTSPEFSRLRSSSESLQTSRSGGFLWSCCGGQCVRWYHRQRIAMLTFVFASGRECRTDKLVHDESDKVHRSSFASRTELPARCSPLSVTSFLPMHWSRPPGIQKTTALGGMPNARCVYGKLFCCHVGVSLPVDSLQKILGHRNILPIGLHPCDKGEKQTKYTSLYISINIL